MRIYILIALLVITHSSSAQQIFPTYEDDPEWNVIDGYSSFQTYFFQTDTWKFSGDTLICGELYSKVDVPIPWTASAYVRVEGERAYIRRDLDCDSLDLLLYDLSLSIGDTVMCASYGYAPDQSFGTARYWVEAIDTIIHFGIPRQHFVMGFYDNDEFPSMTYQMDWVRGIGSLYHPFYPMVQVNLNGHIWHNTICYWEMGDQFYEDMDWQTCDTSSIISAIHEEHDLVSFIGPNPFIHAITLELADHSDHKIALYSSLGALIETIIVKENKITFGEELKPGIYFLEVMQGGVVQILKIMKLEGG